MKSYKYIIYALFILINNIGISNAQAVSNTCDVSLMSFLFGKSVRLQQLKDAIPYGPLFCIKNNNLIDTAFFKTLFNSDENDSSYIYVKLYKNSRRGFTKKVRPTKSINRSYNRVFIQPNSEYCIGMQLYSYFFIKRRGKYKLECFYKMKCGNEIATHKLNDMFFIID